MRAWYPAPSTRSRRGLSRFPLRNNVAGVGYGTAAGAEAFDPSFGCQRITLLSPFANAAIHGSDIGVAHSLQGVRCQRRAESAATVPNQRRARIGYLLRSEEH